jgi:hypothetical protein
MMPLEHTVFDPAAVAHELRTSLREHTAQLTPSISSPADTPMFKTEPDGTIVDRAGRALVNPPAQPKKTPVEVTHGSSNRV